MLFTADLNEVRPVRAEAEEEPCRSDKVPNCTQAETGGQRIWTQYQTKDDYQNIKATWNMKLSFAELVSVGPIMAKTCTYS